MKKTYIIPSIKTTKLNAQHMLALSGPFMNNSQGADQEIDMDVKADDSDNVWDFDWDE